MGNVLVAVGNKSNSRLIEGLLSKRHHIVLFEKGLEISSKYDLIIVDGVMLSIFNKEYILLKNSAGPLFQPILLVTPKKDASRLTGQIWKIVDDLIILPILKMELFARVETLLRTRRQSVELKANQELIRSKEEMAQIAAAKYLSLFNSMDEGVCIIERVAGKDGEPVDFRYVEVNPAFEVQAGIAGVVGKTIHELFPDEALIWCGIYDEVLRTGKLKRFTHDFITKDSILELCAFPFETQNKKKIAVIFRNITEKMKAIESLRESEERTKALVIELQAADKNKNEFISVLSHELRNPLASISAGLQLLEITQDEYQTGKAKEIIKRQMEQLCKLVDDLLDMTRITQNKIKLKKETVNFNEIVRNAIEDIKPEYEIKGVRLGTKIQARPVLLHADPVRITQIIGNVLFNALKFTPKGGMVWLTLKQENYMAVLKVKDNGRGISPKILPRIFKPFTQAENSIDRQDGGLGLGLSIVKGITELHGGSVGVYSAGVGKGAEFTISLPVSDDYIKENGNGSPDFIENTDH